MTTLRAKSSNDHDPEDLHNFRQLLERSFSKFDGDSDDPIGSFIREETGAVEDDKSVKLALERMYGSDAYAEDVESPCEGEYCDIDGECAIPESFKIVPGADSFDVMNFLGIRRAEPLRVNKAPGDWQ